MYLFPTSVSDELIALIAAEPRLCSYFDIPLQHIADPLLASMRRGMSGADIHRRIEKIRKSAPDGAIRTTFIIGYPGETTGHFRRLCAFIEWAKFDKLGVFPFSPEEGTGACTLQPRPRNATVQRRCEEIMTIQREISRENLHRKTGMTVPVMIDRVSEKQPFAFEGRTEWDAPEVDGTVYVSEGGYSPGTLVPLRITDADDYDLYASPPSHIR
jgi:ribosomal protein S12 methylthiotransferase